MINSKYAIGIDIGSVTAKVAVVDNDYKLIYKSYNKHCSDPVSLVKKMFMDIKNEFNLLSKTVSIGVTGSGRELFKSILGVNSINEIVAQATATARLYPGTKTIIEIGGQDSKFIRIGEPRYPKEIRILTQKMNDICAAGTGAFIEQQADRMSITLEEFADISVNSENPAFIAGRCAVFSKSDIVHLQQEGIPNKDIAAGICSAVVRNYIAQFSKGRKFEVPIVFQGGLAANKGVIKAFRDTLELTEVELATASHFEVMGAIGCAMATLENEKAYQKSLDEIINLLTNYIISNKIGSNSLSQLKKLSETVKKTDTYKESRKRTGDLFLGIDVGSTSTCIVAIDEDNAIVKKNYTFNKGELINSVNEAFGLFKEYLAAYDFTVRGIGVTGSGRYLASKYLGADIVKDEISAQVSAAVSIYPEVDTIIEIGGQDSKFIRISEGRVLDFNMNNVCAAGTGYFLQEQAERLNIPISDLSSFAYSSSVPCDLGSRCTVFMESDIITYQQSGVLKRDIAAGLSYAIARNYLEKVVAGRTIGKKILFLGGVAYNESVVSAFENVLDTIIVVPKHHEVSAALGMALITRNFMNSCESKQNTNFCGFENLNKKHEISFFECKDCLNLCKIGKVTFEGSDQSILYGGACGKYDRKKSSNKLPNLFDMRNKLLLSFIKSKSTKSTRGRIGIPRIHLFYELMPLYTVFLQELGYEVVLSDETNRQIAKIGLERTAIDNCYASKVVYGHIQNLIDKDITDIFFPSVIEFERKVKDVDRNYSCPHIQGMPMLIKIAFPDVNFLSPNIFRDKGDCDWKKEFLKLGTSLNIPNKIVVNAIEKATRAQKEFRHNCEQILYKTLMSINPEQRLCVVMGKIYNVCDTKLNLDIANKLLDMGIIPVPFDCLTLSKQELPLNYRDMVWNAGIDLIRVAKYILGTKNLYPVLITNFGCGPDSFIIKFLNELFKEKPFLCLEVDEHTSDVGFVTRLEAFFSNIYRESSVDFNEITKEFQPFIPSKEFRFMDKVLYVPWGFDSYRAIAAAFSSIGFRTKVLPRHDEQTENYARLHSSGRECLPYIMHVGDTIRMTLDPEFDPDKSALLMPASDLACRVSLFSTSIKFVLRDIGYPQIPVIAPRLSMDRDEIVSQFGIKFARNVFRGMLAIETLSRKVTEIRPYEKEKGITDRIYDESLNYICNSIACNKDIFNILEHVLKKLENVETDKLTSRPLIGLIGDDYTRGNSYANNNLIKNVESMGGEVVTVPIWSTFFEFQMGMKPIKTLRRRKYFEYMIDRAKLFVGKGDIQKINKIFNGRIKCYPDASFEEMLEIAREYVDDRSEPLVIMAIAHIIRLLDYKIDGIVNVVGFQCMIHSIISGAMKPIYDKYGNIPNLTLCFDFQEKVHQLNRIEAFMHQVFQNKQSIIDRLVDI